MLLIIKAGQCLVTLCSPVEGCVFREACNINVPINLETPSLQQYPIDLWEFFLYWNRALCQLYGFIMRSCERAGKVLAT